MCFFLGHVTVADPVLHAEGLRKKFANVHLRYLF